MDRGQAHIGTSGFSYDHWQEVFYPPEAGKDRWLEYYCEHFGTVEINTSYYRMPRENVCQSWRERSPEGFSFAMKLNWLITHRERLAGCQEFLTSFLDAAEQLDEKLGPILVQLPPRFLADAKRLAAFLDICPRRRRWAVELRHPSWLCEEIYDVLRAHGAAMVLHDMIEGHPHVITADWAYFRFHGPGGGYSGSYDDATLRAAADEMREHLDSGRDVYAYFNNDAAGHAVENARQLIELVRA